MKYVQAILLLSSFGIEKIRLKPVQRCIPISQRNPSKQIQNGTNSTEKISSITCGKPKYKFIPYMPL